MALIDISKMAGHLIRRLNQISVSVFTEKINDAGYDLTPVQFAALNILQSNPGIDQASLAGLIAYDRVTIGGVVDRLEQKGFIHRRVNSGIAGRGSCILRNGERQRWRQSRRSLQKLQDDILCGLNVSERSQLIRLLEKATIGANALSRAPKRELEQVIDEHAND